VADSTLSTPAIGAERANGSELPFVKSANRQRAEVHIPNVIVNRLETRVLLDGAPYPAPLVTWATDRTSAMIV
jgi:hypothetical protein